ncbi:hypothetical protein GOODEAATRI_034215 [Goodea atripinnis]|uniref:Uncharacterized protein n=1 Tax=Goodea atripinnis TaxID=208336 RepID=A0ABV0NQK1_9TELE
MCLFIAYCTLTIAYFLVTELFCTPGPETDIQSSCRAWETQKDHRRDYRNRPRAEQERALGKHPAVSAEAQGSCSDKPAGPLYAGADAAMDGVYRPGRYSFPCLIQREQYLNRCIDPLECITSFYKRGSF